jgi:uncharacterized protein YggE
VKPYTFAALTGSLLLVSLALILVGYAQREPTNRSMADAPPAQVIVTGDGAVRVKPDMVIIAFGLLTKGASAAEAEALHLASARRLQEALIATEADALDLEANQLGLRATTYQDFAGVTRISGYEAQSVIRVGSSQIGRAQALVDAGLAAGATSMESPFYTLENPESARQAALRDALENARTRGLALAKVEGERLGRLSKVEALPDEEAISSPSPTILTVRARVTATFER